MWYLEAFDKETEFLVQDWPLPGLEEDTLRPLVEIDDDDDEPPAPAAFDFKSMNAVREIARHVDEKFKIDESYDYQISYYAEPGEEGVTVNGLYPSPRDLPEAFENLKRVKAKTPVFEEDTP